MTGEPWRLRCVRAAAAAIALLMAAAPIASCDRSGGPASSDDRALPLAIEVEDGPLKATVARSAETVGVADPLIVDLIAEGPASYDATLPADTALAPFEVVSRTRPERAALPGDRVATRVRLTVTSDRAGDLELPALAFAFAPGASGVEPAAPGGPATLTTPAIPIAVASLLDADSDPTAYIGNKPAATRTDDRSRRWLALAVAGGLAALAACTAVVVIARRRHGVPPPTPVEWANTELERLAADGLGTRGEVEPFFVRLTGIAREFIRRQLGIAAPMRTSDEFLRDLGHDPRLAPSQQAHLDRLMRFGDLVKFARQGADQRACADAMDAVRGLVSELAVASAIRNQEPGVRDPVRLRASTNDVDTSAGIHHLPPTTPRTPDS